MKKWLIIIAITVIVFIIAWLCTPLEQWNLDPCIFLSKMVDKFVFPAIATIIGGLVVVYITKIKNIFLKSDYKEAEQLLNDGKYKIAFLKMKELAERGYAKAQYKIAEMYHEEQGGIENFDEAIKWYYKSAKQGYLPAQNNLGDIYRAINDYEKAIKWYRKAAKKGNSEAQYNLGQMYHFGRGVRQDYNEAVKWYDKAIKQGNNKAKNNLAGMYANGDGVEQDSVKAKKLTLEAAIAGNVKAQSNMALLYNEKAELQNEKAVQFKYYKKAFKWFSKAAKQGHAQSQYGIALAYYGGLGVSKSFIKSYMWFTIVLNSRKHITKEEYAKYYLQDLVRRMTFADIAKGKEMAKRCVESGYKNCS